MRVEPVVSLGKIQSTAAIIREVNVRQLITIDWYPIAFGEMPDCEGTYLVAFSDGTVESYPMDHRDINDGEVRCGHIVGEYWAQSPPHPSL